MRELTSLLAELRDSNAASSADGACMDMTNLSLMSTQPQAMATPSNGSPITSSAALDPVTSQDKRQHVSCSLDQDVERPCSTDIGTSRAHTAGAEGVSSGEGSETAVQGDEEDDDEGDSDSVLDFQPQELTAQETKRVVGATTVLRCTFTAIKGSPSPPPFHRLRIARIFIRILAFVCVVSVEFVGTVTLAELCSATARLLN